MRKTTFRLRSSVSREKGVGKKVRGGIGQSFPGENIFYGDYLTIEGNCTSRSISLRRVNFLTGIILNVRG